MRTAAVIEIEILARCLSGNGNSLVAVQKHFFILHRFPEPFDKDIVTLAALAIHADLDGVLFEYADKG